MDRRGFILAGLGGFCGTLAGCTGSSDPVKTETTTSNPTTEAPTEGGGEAEAVGPRFEVVSFNRPETAEVGEEVQIELVVRNTGDEPGEFTAAIEAKVGGSNWQPAGDVETGVIPPGETGTWTSNVVEYPDAMLVQYRIEKADLEFTIEVTRPPVELEYTISAGTSPDSIPEDIRKSRDEGGRRKEGYQWVVVTFDVVQGPLDMEDLWFRSRVETEERYYDLDHATGELVDGVQSRGTIKEGGSGIALYQIPADAESYGWNLEETRQDIAARRA